MCKKCNSTGARGICIKASPMLLEFKDRFLAAPLKDLLALFKITTSEFYDTVHACNYAERIDRTTKIKSPLTPFKYPTVRCEETLNSFKRVKRLSLILMNNEPPLYPEISEDENQKIFYGRKIYDAELERAMWDISNQVAQLFDFEPLGMPMSIECIVRDKFNFIEYVFLSCLYTAVGSQSIRVLNKPADTKDRRRTAKDRFKKFYVQLQILRNEFIFTFLMYISNSLEKAIEQTIDSDNCIALSDATICDWFGPTCFIAEWILYSDSLQMLDLPGAEIEDCKKILMDEPDFISKYNNYLESRGLSLSDVSISVYSDAYCVALYTDQIIQLVIERVPELFRAFQESSIIPDGERVYDYMKRLSEDNQK